MRASNKETKKEGQKTSRIAKNLEKKRESQNRERVIAKRIKEQKEREEYEKKAEMYLEKAVRREEMGIRERIDKNHKECLKEDYLKLLSALESAQMLLRDILDPLKQERLPNMFC